MDTENRFAKTSEQIRASADIQAVGQMKDALEALASLRSLGVARPRFDLEAPYGRASHMTRDDEVLEVAP